MAEKSKDKKDDDVQDIDDLLDATLDDFKKLNEEEKKAKEWSKDFLGAKAPLTPANSYAESSLLEEPKPDPPDLDLNKLLEQLSVDKDDKEADLEPICCP